MSDLRSNEHCLSSSKNRTQETFRVFFKKPHITPPLFFRITTFQLLKFCSPFIFLFYSIFSNFWKVNYTLVSQNLNKE